MTRITVDNNGVWLGCVWREGVVPCVVTVRDGDVFDITSKDAPTVRDITETDAPAPYVATAEGECIGAAGELPNDIGWLAPCDFQAIKACGVTFARSMVERVIEERASGDPKKAEAIRARIAERIGASLSDIEPGSKAAFEAKSALIEEGLWSQYLEVGIGADAEVFSKAQMLSSVGPFADIGLHPSSANPGVIVLPNGAAADALKEQVAKAAEAPSPQTMLTSQIAKSYDQANASISQSLGVERIHTSAPATRAASPNVYSIAADDWQQQKDLHSEVFGPTGFVVTAQDKEQMLQVARGLQGQLTATLHFSERDVEDAKAFVPILETKAGRILANGLPTGVEDCDAMVHGGPYPATTNFGATSVGTRAIRRFLRPVCYQDIPLELMPQI